MNDRNLLRSLVEGAFSAPLYEWDRDWFERNLGTPVWEGTVEVAQGALNADVVTEVPLAEVLLPVTAMLPPDLNSKSYPV